MKDLVQKVEEMQSEFLDGKQTITSLTAKINELVKRVQELENGSKKDRGPKSERQMTAMDAFRIKYGDLKDLSHKMAAEELNLSYGQIYSARGNYTFREVDENYKEFE